MSLKDLDKHHSEAIDGVKDSNDSFNTYDIEAERKVIRKVDWHILPLAFGYYLFSFLDRVNIGNGRLYGLEEDLGLKGNQFQTATSLFFVTYVAVEVPSTIFLKKLQPKRFINSLAISWGIIATLTGIIHNYSSFVALRLLLGIAEGPLFPCLILYLTYFYTRNELAVRIGYLVSGAAIAGAVSGLLAYGIGYMDHYNGLRAWRWLLIIEGLPSICLGLLGLFYLADSPDKASYLTCQERDLIQKRRNRDSPEALTPSAQILHRADVIAAIRDWRVWAFCVQNFAADIQLFSYAIFLPTIIKALNAEWSTLRVQALTVPCFVWSMMVYFAAAFISDAINRRGVFCFLGAIVCIVGHVMLIAGRNVATTFAGCFVVATGLFTVSGLALTWLPSNMPRYGKRSTAVGMQLMIGNSAGVAAPYLYPTTDGPRYVMGHAVTAATLGLSAVITLVLWAAYARSNKRRREGREDGKMIGLTEQEIDDLGDESPRFVYTT